MPYKFVQEHIWDKYLKKDRLPHIWCPGCGLGTALSAFLMGIELAKIDLDKLVVVSGIGCAGRAAGYLNVDTFHTTHGRPIPFAIGLKLARPDLHVVVFSGDGDLATIGGNHLIHAARRNHDILVICSNNFNYGMTGGQVGATTPENAITTTTPYGNLENPFDLPYLVTAAGAVYVARWTSLHVRRLAKSIAEALQLKGFRFIEVLSQCPTVYGRRNNMPTGLDMLKFFKENCVIKNYAHPKDVEIKPGKKIIIGKFVDKTEEKLSFEDKVWNLIKKLERGK
ncbi:MAG: thiamine pyrophosphate-dependent enzyme [Candidatus Njordarchaeum guaymaensis]